MTLGSPHLSIDVDPLGAQLSALRDAAGRDLLWGGDPRVWAGRAPLLFPIVGTLVGGSYRLGTQRYALPRHGFARVSPFSVVEATQTSALFKLAASAATLAVYPFKFELEMRFTIEGTRLAMTATVRNTGADELPASLGFHPGFRWPLPGNGRREAHYIEFEAEEPDPIRRIGAGGLLQPAAFATPVAARRLSLGDALFAEDVVILDRLRSRSLTYGSESGARIGIHFPDATHLGIWTKPGAQFVCIEPWRGVTDPEGFADDFRRKPGAFIVKPGDTQSLQMLITL
ncbi:MAG: aldose 1-epimerase family protein [Pseudomonadota bacterium]